jgi:hypothetical protein
MRAIVKMTNVVSRASRDLCPFKMQWTLRELLRSIKDYPVPEHIGEWYKEQIALIATDQDSRMVFNTINPIYTS